MNPQNQYEREEDDICRRHAQGLITQTQCNEEMRQLQRDYRESCEEAVREAGERERENW